MTIKEFIEYTKELGLSETSDIYHTASGECGCRHIFDNYSISTTRIGGFDGENILCIHPYQSRH